MASTSDLGLKAEVGVGEGSEMVMAANDQLLLYRGLKKARKERGCTAKERISKMPPCTAGKRSSIYRGVTRHRWTGRYEAHLWDKSTWNQNQNKKGKQVYLGAYDDEEAAARAYDLAALKYWGPGTLINFPVTDYTRDLEEMQSVSREDFLASLRRKSSGFSRGIAKYRGLSSRAAGSEFFNSGHYGDDVATESDFLGGFCVERKIDLTPYIKWWGANKVSQAESATKAEETKNATSENLNNELKASELVVMPTEPYQMPRLGASSQGRTSKRASPSAMSVLSQSSAFKSLQEKASKKKEFSTANDQNENKNTINIMDRGKAAAESSVSYDRGSDSLGPPVGIGGGLSLQRNMFPLTPFLSAPLLTCYNTIDPLIDPILWTPLLPVHPTGQSHTSEVKAEASLTNTSFFLPERGTEHNKTPFNS